MDIIEAIKEVYPNSKVEFNSDYDCFDMKGVNIDDDIYIVGDYDVAHEAAVKEAAQTFDDCFSDSDKVDWLQKNNWPGVREDDVCDDLSDDSSDYDDGETPYRPESIDDYIETMGYSKASDCMSWDFLRAHTSLRSIGSYIVDCDGIANSLARYDGEEVEFGDFYGYRVE